MPCFTLIFPSRNPPPELSLPTSNRPATSTAPVSLSFVVLSNQMHPNCSSNAVKGSPKTDFCSSNPNNVNILFPKKPSKKPFQFNQGSVELAAVGVSVSIFNLVSRLFNVPLLNITTSFVAEEQALISKSKDDGEFEHQGKKVLPSVSTSLALAAGLGIAEAVVLSVGSGFLMNIMGIPMDSSMRGQARKVIYNVLKIGLATGFPLAVFLFIGFEALSGLFTTDAEVLQIAWSGTLFVVGSQPVNAVAFVLDGLYYGVSDYEYVAVSMVVVGLISSAFLLVAAPLFSAGGVWNGLFLFMTLRVVAGFWRLGTKSGHKN